MYKTNFHHDFVINFLILFEFNETFLSRVFSLQRIVSFLFTFYFLKHCNSLTYFFICNTRLLYFTMLLKICIFFLFQYFHAFFCSYSCTWRFHFSFMFLSVNFLLAFEIHCFKTLWKQNFLYSYHLNDLLFPFAITLI